MLALVVARYYPNLTPSPKSKHKNLNANLQDTGKARNPVDLKNIEGSMSGAPVPEFRAAARVYVEGQGDN